MYGLSSIVPQPADLGDHHDNTQLLSMTVSFVYVPVSVVRDPIAHVPHRSPAGQRRQFVIDPAPQFTRAEPGLPEPGRTVASSSLSLSAVPVRCPIGLARRLPRRHAAGFVRTLVFEQP